MRLHKLTLVFLIFTLILVLLNAYKFYNYKSWDRHYYSLAVGAATYHPIYGNFTLTTKNGEEFSVFNNEDFGNWGRAYNLDFEYMQLPDSLSAHWIGLREEKIYEGKFKLPHQKIDSLFKVDNPNKAKFQPYGKSDIDAYTFVIGIEPEGFITLWIEGNHKYQKEIARFKAQTTDKYLENATAQESIDIVTERLFDRSQTRQLDSVFKHKIPADIITWKKYSKKYDYALKFENFPSNITEVVVNFLNEEKAEFSLKNKTEHFIESGVPLYFRTNKIENDEDIRLKLPKDLMNNFEEKKSKLKTGDTLVFLVNYNKSQKSMHSSLTTVREIKP